MGNSPSEPKLPEAEERSVLNYDVSSKAIAEKIRTLAETRTAGVVVMAGAGISVSAGIPGSQTSDIYTYIDVAFAIFVDNSYVSFSLSTSLVFL